MVAQLNNLAERIQAAERPPEKASIVLPFTRLEADRGGDKRWGLRLEPHELFRDYF